MAESWADELSTRPAPGGPATDAGPDSTADDWGTDPDDATDRDPLLMLLLRWEEAVARGEDPGVRTLCDGDAAMAAALGERIIKRRRLHALLAVPAKPAEDRAEPPPPEFPGYDVLGRLGRGGMGIVYRARDVRLGRIVALKTLAEARYATEEQVERFLDEARAVARLRHPNIVGIHAIGEHEGQPYLSLEYVEGETLAGRLSAGPLAFRPAAALIETLARAIDAAHRAGVVHRDLKPGNVLLTPEGVPKVSDFGLAKLMDSDSARTRSGQLMGTPCYMAPEQAEGHSDRAGPPADVHAIGAILYQALSGRPPFMGDSALETMKLVACAEPVPPTRLRPGVPRDLETICLKALEKEPSRRYATAAAMADDLQRWLDGRSIAARPVGAGGRLLRWARRNRTLAVVSAVLAAVFAMGTPGFFALWLTARSDRARAVAALAEADRARHRAEDARDRAWHAIGYIFQNEGTDLEVEEARPYRQALTAAGLDEARKMLDALEGDPASEMNWITGHLAMVMVQHDAGRVREAIETNRKAVALAEAFDARQGSPQLRELLATALHRLGALAGDPAECREHTRRSNAIYEALGAGRTDGPIAHAVSMAQNHHNIGDKWFIQGRLAEAEVSFLAAVHLCDEDIRRGDRGAGIRLELLRSLLYLGRVRLWTGRAEQAIEPIRRAIDTGRALLDEKPADYAITTKLYQAHEELGHTYFGLRRFDDCITAHEAACAVMMAAAERHKGIVSRVAEIQGQIAIADFNVADVADDDLGRFHREYRESYAEACRICDKLESVEPLSDDLRMVLGLGLLTRVEARTEDGERPDPEDFSRSERLLEQQRSVPRWNLHARTYLIILRRDWADELETLGRSTEARAIRDRAAAAARGDGEALFEAALIIANRARWIGTYPIRIDAPSLRGRLLRNAVACVEQAIAEGFRDAARLHAEPFLAILADDPDFRAAAAALDDLVFPADPFASR